MLQKINIDQIAELARLNLKPAERDKLAKDLEGILAYVSQLQELSADKVPPTSHVLPIENVFRKDFAKLSDIREAVLKHAPKCEGKFFKVPKVIEGA
ncbi:MAG: asparaginyl/glutamyl-tRNA amidotransferase subunit C [Omnitrophica bacterium RIFCSPHIGHO2_02_FULL_46_11]|nr:MAG: asparaginyl/glutamyl-tRNA amidotransferase subunit C [Omnitrophica bacterium RIFCSPLOWO2_01_FULL_45_10b]OGW86500.1 MAG: asparaginyl/glutamyl-tRNA amidotransferase subunit C [Omnitrophica bacterium RIFCSPHIGHO2_02_FULL_46_11]